MFDLAWSEILLVGVIALIVVGPKDLPDLLRTVGQWVRRARGMASNFQSTFDQMMRDEEMAKAKRELEASVTSNTIARPSYAPTSPPFDHSTLDEAEAAEAAEAEPAEETPAVEGTAGEAPVAEAPVGDSKVAETPAEKSGSAATGS
ncbi:MAG: Sec-independent protein translocase protein TatB [Zavarzinia sp.]|nr:Sec-independent protein translocase protein TatB [Zavarzinia sp.]